MREPCPGLEHKSSRFWRPQEHCSGLPAEQLWQASAARAAAEERNGNGAAPVQRFLEPRSRLRARPRDIAFFLVEGDFQVSGPPEPKP